MQNNDKNNAASANKIKIALLGLGTVGSGVMRVFGENGDVMAFRTGATIEIKTVLVRDAAKKRDFIEDNVVVTENIEDILKDEEIKIVVEMIGGINPALDYMTRALKAKKSVVTANKDVLAEHGGELLQLAEENGVDFFFEASVGGGIPIILPLRKSLSANRVTEIMGIVNGTTNYMLTKMTEEGASFETALKEAQDLGYAEADPTADVDGLDAARKAVILASLAFNTKVSLKDVDTKGIRKIKPLDIEYARELGYVIKLLAVGRESDKGIELAVHPVFLPKGHPLAAVNGVFNAIFVRGNAIGEAMFYGQGAGSLPTASAVAADIVEVGRDIVNGTLGSWHGNPLTEKKICPTEETESGYYVRLLVDDKPGVLGLIATAFGNSSVSLKSVMQTKRSIPEHAEIVAITHRVTHKFMESALDRLKNLTVVDEIKNVIRVEN